jgi:hypothetical protein
MADLKDFPIGTTFYYKGLLLTVIETSEGDHLNDTYILAHYVSKNGELHSQCFYKQSWDYLLSIIEDQQIRAGRQDVPSAPGPSA